MEIRDRWSLVFGHHPDWLETGLLALCTMVVLAEIFFHLRQAIASKSTSGLHYVTALMRLLAMCLGLALCLELTLRIHSLSPSKTRVVILVDDSQSMQIADSPLGEPSGSARSARWKRVEQVWQRSKTALQNWRNSGHIVEIIRFGQRTEQIETSSPSLYPKAPQERASHLASALSEIFDDQSSSPFPLAAVVILSDGLVAYDEASEEYLNSVANQMQVPITSYSAGAEHLVDLGFVNLRAGEFAFVENVTNFEIDLVSHGIDRPVSSKVELHRNGDLIETKSVNLLPGSHTQSLKFRHAPDRTGQFVYEFRVLPLENEATRINNRRSFVVKVLRDKVRVLHVAGRPNWDVRSLRSLLKRDPNVELLSYYILRDREDLNRDDSSAPLSLIQFPTDELFNEQLGSFDLLILHNFDARTHNDPLGGDYVHNIANYVRQGGALVIIGGDLGLATGDFAQSSLEPLIPIDIHRATGISFDPFRPELTSAGKRHPITSWMTGISAKTWQELPKLDSFNPSSLRNKPNDVRASALLYNPSSTQANGAFAPLLAVSEPEKGRVVTISSGSLWRYGFAPNLPLVDGTRPYDRLWLNMIRWLLRDEQAARLQLEADASRYDRDGSVELRAQTWNSKYQPQSNAKLQWSLSVIDNSQYSTPSAKNNATDTNEESTTGTKPSASANATGESAGLPNSPSLLQGQWLTDSSGKASERILHLPAGAYVVRAEWNDAEHNDEQMRVQRVFVIGDDPHEFVEVDAKSGRQRLHRLSKQTQGLFLNSDSNQSLPHDLPVRTWNDQQMPQWHVDRQKDIPLWSGWIVFSAVLLGLAGEWWLRRYCGEA